MRLLLVASGCCAVVCAAPWNDPVWVKGSARACLPAEAGNYLIRTKLLTFFAARGNTTAFMVARLGMGAELGVAHAVATGSDAAPYLGELATSAGVYPATRAEAANFAREYVRAIEATAAHNGVMERWCGRCIVVGNRAVEPFYFREPWSRELRGRTVLVVHPFAATIAAQYDKHRNGSRLWGASEDLLPGTMWLKIVRAPVTFAAAPKPHASWSETLEATKAAIDAAAPFDAALLGCGAYGLPLTRHVHDRHAVPALYLGGALQLLFAIKGRRWVDRPEWRAVMNNNHWVRPSADETPPGAHLVEAATYW